MVGALQCLCSGVSYNRVEIFGGGVFLHALLGGSYSGLMLQCFLRALDGRCSVAIVICSWYSAITAFLSRRAFHSMMMMMMIVRTQWRLFQPEGQRLTKYISKIGHHLGPSRYHSPLAFFTPRHLRSCFATAPLILAIARNNFPRPRLPLTDQ